MSDGTGLSPFYNSKIDELEITLREKATNLKVRLVLVKCKARNDAQARACGKYIRGWRSVFNCVNLHGLI